MKAHSPFSRGSLGILTASLMAASTVTSFGAVRTWSGASSANWSDSGNWQGGVAPSAGDDFVFATASGAPHLSDNTNDFTAGFLVNNITLGVNADTTLSGNAISLGGSVTNNSTKALTLRTSISLTTGTHLFANSSTINLGTSAVPGFTLSGNGGITKTGAGRMTIYNGATNNSFSGGLVVQEGIVQIANSSAAGTAFGTGGLTIQASGTVTLNQKNLEVRGLSGAGLITNEAVGNGSINVNTSSDSNNFSGTISNVSALTSVIKSGSGVLFLSGTSSTYGGTTTVSAGTLQVAKLANGGSASSIGQSASTASNLVIDGGTLKYTGSGDSTNRLFTIGAGGATLDASGSGALSFTAVGNLALLTNNISRTMVLTGSNAGDNTLASVLADGPTSGGGTAYTSLTKSGIGTWVLTGANTFTGGVTVTEGSLKLSGSNNRLSTQGAITVSGGSLDLGGNLQQTSGSVTLSGGSINNGTLEKTGGNFNATAGAVGAALGGNAGLVKTGTGSLTLSGSNTFSGATTVSGGRLIVNGSIAQSSGVLLQNGAILSGHGRVSNISGTGTVSAGNSPGILTASSVDGSGGLGFTFEFTTQAVDGVSTPLFSDAAASGNDLLRLTSNTPFTFDLDLSNTITLDFRAVSLQAGDVYQGAFFTDGGDFLNSFANANLVYLGLGSLSMSVSTIQTNANFAGGVVNGYITQFTVVPEPGNLILTGGALLGAFVGIQRFRKRGR